MQRERGANPLKALIDRAIAYNKGVEGKSLYSLSCLSYLSLSYYLTNHYLTKWLDLEERQAENQRH